MVKQPTQCHIRIGNLGEIDTVTIIFNDGEVITLTTSSSDMILPVNVTKTYNVTGNFVVEAHMVNSLGVEILNATRVITVSAGEF